MDRSRRHFLVLESNQKLAGYGVAVARFETAPFGGAPVAKDGRTGAFASWQARHLPSRRDGPNSPTLPGNQD
jgi:hypothetical protein